MPYGPQGQWRPADPGACARLVCDIATGESLEVYAPPDEHQRERALLAAEGGKARADKLAPERRSEIAAEGGKALWARRNRKRKGLTAGACWCILLK